MNSPCLVSVVHLAYFVVFEGGFQVFVVAFYRRSQGWTLLLISKDLDREAVFSPKYESAARFCPPTQRRIVHCPPFRVGLEKSSNFPNAAPLMCRTKLNKVRLRSDFGATVDSDGVIASNLIREACGMQFSMRKYAF